MWHSHQSSDARSKRFKIVVALATGLFWMSSGTVIWQAGPFTLQSPASAESYSVPPQPTLSSQSRNQTRKLTRRLSEDSTIPSHQSTPSTISKKKQTRNKLTRRPLVAPVSPKATQPLTTTPTNTTQTVGATGNGANLSLAPSPESTTPSTKRTNTATAVGSVTAPVLVPSSQSILPSASANLTPLAPVGKLSEAPQSGPSSESGAPRKLTQRPEVAGIIAPLAQAAPPSPPPPSRRPDPPGCCR